MCRVSCGFRTPRVNMHDRMNQGFTESATDGHQPHPFPLSWIGSRSTCRADDRRLPKAILLANY
jgi:hypothetical protein